jgi:DNA primase
MISPLVEQIAATYSLRRSGSRWAGPCPKCGGGGRSDKFSLREDGGFKCYGCDFKGDAITWLREMEGKSCAEAHDQLGLPCRSTSCPQAASCRLGSGAGPAPPRRRARTLAPPRPAADKPLAIASAMSPAEQWSLWAEQITDRAHACLLTRDEDLAWLDRRGVSLEAVRRHRLGWLEHDRKVPRSAIGLPPREDKKTLWLPSGLLIPIIDQDQVHRLRIRRTPEARERFLPDLKYVWVEGSGAAPLVIRPGAGSRGLVVVEAELDAMAIAAAHAEVTVVALGTVAGGMTAELQQEAAAAPLILVALDADRSADGKRGAGPRAVATWCHQFRQARFLPVPRGKDAGEYAEAGGDLHQWLEEQLPPVVVVSAAPDQPVPLAVETEGGQGESDDSMAALITGLREHEGWIERQRPELFVRFRRWPASKEQAAARNQLVWLAFGVHGDGRVARLLELLPDGRYGHGSLTEFFKGA